MTQIDIVMYVLSSTRAVLMCPEGAHGLEAFLRRSILEWLFPQITPHSPALLSEACKQPIEALMKLEDQSIRRREVSID
jgi:hypothetical protein